MGSGAIRTDLFGGMFGFKFKTQCAIFPVFGEDEPAVKKATAFALSLPDRSDKNKIATVILSSKPSNQDSNIKYCTKLSNTTINFRECSGEFLVAKLSQEQSKLVEKRLKLDDSSAVTDTKTSKKIYVVQASGNEPKKYEVKRDAVEGRYRLVLSDSERGSLDQNPQLFIGAPVFNRKSSKPIGFVKSINNIEDGTLSVAEFTSEIIDGLQDYIWEKDTADSGEVVAHVLDPNISRKKRAPAVESNEGLNGVAHGQVTNASRTERLSVPTVESNEGINDVARPVSSVKRPESIPTAESDGGVDCVAKQEIAMAPTLQERVKYLDFKTRQEICMELEVPRCLGGDYKTLAGLLNMKNNHIQYIGTKDDPANQVLTWWEANGSATVDELERLFKEMGRHDLVLILENRPKVSVRACETNDNEKDNMS